MRADRQDGGVWIGVAGLASALACFLHAKTLDAAGAPPSAGGVAIFPHDTMEGSPPAPSDQPSGTNANGPCETWTYAAAAEFNVPTDLMLAILRVETWRASDDGGHSWPWAVNLAGTSHWFESRSEAESFVRGQLSQQGVSLDIGCFQLNTRWHGAAFPDVSRMFEPSVNSRYAARFLAALYDEMGSWSAAAAAFHSRTPEIGARYLSRVEAAMVETRPPPGPAAQPRAPVSPMATGKTEERPAQSRLGSLVPVVQAVGPSINSATRRSP